MAVRLARRRPGAAADGLFPSTRHSSARSGAAAAALERSLRGSCSAPAQQHRIAARRRGAGRGGHGAAPLAVVRSNGGHARPLEHAAIFSCHGGGAAGAAGRTGRSSSSGGRRRAEGRVLYERWGGGRRCASLLLRPGQRERLIRVRSRGAEERERERQVPVGFIRSSEMVWMEKDGNGKRAASYGAGRDGRREKAGVIGPTCRCLIHIERICGLVL
jgi:hypothetical protein